MRIDLLGTSFSIETDESPEYLERIISYYEERLREIESSVSTTDPLKKAILAAILSIDELFSLKEEHADEKEVSQITEQLIRKLDESLQGLPEFPEEPRAERPEE